MLPFAYQMKMAASSCCQSYGSLSTAFAADPYLDSLPRRNDFTSIFVFAARVEILLSISTFRGLTRAVECYNGSHFSGGAL